MVGPAIRAIGAVMFLASAVWGALPPEKAISLDFSWVPAPTMGEGSTGASAVRMQDFVRLSSRSSEQGSEMLWALRYPVDLSQYPVVVMRYRAATMDAGSDRPLLSLVPTVAGEPTIVAMRVGDVDQDSYLHEHRFDLGPSAKGLAGGFAIALPPGALRFDVVELRFETRGANTAKSAIQQQVQLLVSDESGKGIRGAEVKVGPLERGNWVTRATTPADGLAMLTANIPAEGNSPRGVPIEAAIDREGFRSQYIAHVDAGQGQPLAANMTRVVPEAIEPAVADAVPAAAPTQAEPAPVYAQTPPVVQNYYYNDYVDDYRDRGYGHGYGYGGWWGGYYPGYVVIIRDDDDDDDDDDNGNGGGNGGGGDDDGKPKGPRKWTLPDYKPVVPQPTTPRYTMDHSPNYGVTAAPRYGVSVAPRYGINVAPRYGFNPAPSHEVKASPRLGFRNGSDNINRRSGSTRLEAGASRVSAPRVTDRPSAQSRTAVPNSPSRSAAIPISPGGASMR